MDFVFCPKRMIQVVMYLLALNKRKLSLSKLMNMLYLIDRKSFDIRDISISLDVCFNTPNGPMLSQTLNILNDLSNSNWQEYIEIVEIDNHPTVKLKKKIRCDRLSHMDKEHIETIAFTYKNHTPDELIEHIINLPEMKS